jgi:hypothetical protein
MAMTRQEFERKMARNFQGWLTEEKGREVVIRTGMKFAMVECLVPLDHKDDLDY